MKKDFETKTIRIDQFVNSLNYSKEDTTKSSDITNNAHIIIPQFQRDYVWTTKNTDSIKLLFISLYKGYPIGSITASVSHDSNMERTFTLIDGLQRTFSIVNIMKSPWKYISYNLISEILKKRKIKHGNLDSTEFKNIHEVGLEISNSWKGLIDKIVIQLNSLKNHEEAIHFLNNFEKKNRDLSIRTNIILEEIKKLIDWSYYDIANGLNAVKLQLTVLTNYNRYEISDIFNLMNSTGKPLNEFERNSSIWSWWSIDSTHSTSFIIDILSKRMVKYCKAITNSEHEKIICLQSNIREENNTIIPSDYIYAILYKFLSNKRISNIKLIFEDDNGSLGDITQIIYLFINLMYKDKFDLSWGMKNIGEYVYTKVSEKEENKQAKEWVKLFIDAFEVINDKFPFLLYISNLSSTKDDIFKYLNISKHFLIAIANQVINNGIDNSKKFFGKKELLIRLLESKVIKGKGYSSSSSVIAKKAVVENWFFQKLTLDDCDRISKQVSFSLSNPTRRGRINDLEKILLITIQQGYSLSTYGSIEFDHVIPYNSIKKLGLEDSKYEGKYLDLIKMIDSIYNKQLLSIENNRKKGKKIWVEEMQFDPFIKTPIFLSKEEYKKILIKISDILNKSSNIINSDDIESFKESFTILYNARKDVIENELTEIFSVS